MSNRVTGPTSPDPQRNQPIQSQAEKDQAKKVGKIEKIDPDEETRNRRKERFKAMMDEADDVDLSANSKGLSPFDLFASSPVKKSLGNIEDSALPSPNSSPPPSVSQPAPSHEAIEEDLPHSDKFWSSTPLPDEPISSHPLMRANSPKKQIQSKKEEDPLTLIKEPKESGKKEKKGAPHPSHLSPFSKDSSSKPNEKEESIQPKKRKTSQKNEPDAAPFGRYWEMDQKIEKPIPAGSSKKEESAELKKKSPHEKRLVSREKEEEIENKTAPMPNMRHSSESVYESIPTKKKVESDHPVFSPKDLPFAHQMTPDMQNIAFQAAFQAQPYLSPEVLPIFLQLVASIMVMTTRSGMNQTQIKLDGAAFEKSKFYGSIIEITKYSTAPNSINIRLSGPNQAVDAFNQNLSSLRNAFEQGNFNFRIGRLEAEYKAERPIFRRKKGLGGNSSGGDDGTQDRGR